MHIQYYVSRSTIPSKLHLHYLSLKPKRLLQSSKSNLNLSHGFEAFLALSCCRNTCIGYRSTFQFQFPFMSLLQALGTLLLAVLLFSGIDWLGFDIEIYYYFSKSILWVGFEISRFQMLTQQISHLNCCIYSSHLEFQLIDYNYMYFPLKSTFIVLVAALIASASGNESLHKPVHPFGREQADLIFKKHHPAVMVLLADQDEGVPLFTIASQLSPEYPNVLFTYSKADEEVYSKLIQLVGTHRLKGPNLLYFSAGPTKYLYQIQEWGQYSAARVRDFIAKAQNNEIDQFLKSKDSSQDIPQNYIQINKKYLEYHNSYTFRDALKNSQKQFLVDLYAFWCPYSQQFNLEMLQLAKRFANNDNIVFVKMDASENEIKGFQLEGYPTVLFYGKDKSVAPAVFTGSRSVESIGDWMKSLTSYPWVEPMIEDPKSSKIEAVGDKEGRTGMTETEQSLEVDQTAQGQEHVESGKQHIKLEQTVVLQQL